MPSCRTPILHRHIITETPSFLIAITSYFASYAIPCDILRSCVEFVFFALDPNTPVSYEVPPLLCRHIPPETLA